MFRLHLDVFCVLSFCIPDGRCILHINERCSGSTIENYTSDSFPIYSKTQCAMHCTLREDCKGFQLIENTPLCALKKGVPCSPDTAEAYYKV